MNAFLNPNSNGPSLTGVIDVTAHSISLFQENEKPQNINNISYLKVILVLLNLMVFRSMKQEIILLRCINSLDILMTEELVD